MLSPTLPPPTRQWKQSKDFNPLTLYFREKEMEKEVGCGVGGTKQLPNFSSLALGRGQPLGLLPKSAQFVILGVRSFCLSLKESHSVD